MHTQVLFFLALFGLSFTPSAFAQLVENFEDMEFHHTPNWNGDTTSWQVNNASLKSNHTLANSQFYLSTASKIAQNTQWKANVDLQFNPSSANYVDIYLISDQENLKEKNKNGYFVRLGGTKDEISLYKTVAGKETVVIDGQDGILNKSQNTIALKVTCDSNFNWKLERNLSTIRTEWVSEGSNHDFMEVETKWFGILVTQSTASFFQKHSFSQLEVTRMMKDTTPPRVVEKQLENERLIIRFNEEVDPLWVQKSQAFEFKNQNGTSIVFEKILQDSLSRTVYYFYTTEPIPSGQYILTIREACDLSGNKARKEEILSFSYISFRQAIYNEIRLNELMIDPVPSVGLPETEYIELYNPTNQHFNLKDYVLSDPISQVKLPTYILPPHGYALLLGVSDSLLFNHNQPLLLLPSLPSLGNTADVISLYNAKGLLVDRVHYSSTWYQDSEKDEGGYALELIDPLNSCAIEKNWAASTDAKGGTPGFDNSISHVLNDSTPPHITAIDILSESLLQIVFSESIDTSHLSLANIDIPETSLQSIIWQRDSLNIVRVNLSTPIKSGIVYEMLLKGIKDCPGNTSNELQATFAKTRAPKPGELLLNELLFNPNVGASDFVELYNNSEELLDLKDIHLANWQKDTISNKKILFKSTQLLMAHGYLAVTTDKEGILNLYPKSASENIKQINSLPTFPDDLGSVILLYPDGQLLDRFDYNETMHSLLLAKKDGVSLEKIHPTLPSNEHGNWHSAAKEVGYATPGLPNSQTILLGLLDEHIGIDPIMITPNGDGDKDFLTISIQTDQLSALRSIIIFDAVGREVKRLLRNSYAGAHTLVQWDGTNDAGGLLPFGHYILWMEAIDKDGNTKHYKKKAVIGAKF